MIKMIVMDMDGTLLNNESKLTPYTIETLVEAQNKGIRLVLSSGRSHITLRDFAAPLTMKSILLSFLYCNFSFKYSSGI